MTTNRGWNSSVHSQATEEWESSGKFLVFNQGVRGGTGESSSVPHKRSVPSTPRVKGRQSLDSRFYMISEQMPTIHMVKEEQASMECEKKSYVVEERHF